MIRTAAITLAAWLSMISAWLAIREIRWIYWRDRCGQAEVERDHWRRMAVFWQQEAGNSAKNALRWRLHLKDCARGGKTAAQRHDTIKAQTTAALRGEG